MTVLATVLTSECIAFASDSFLTRAQPDGTLEVAESKQTKLVRVEAFRGIAGYCGLAQFGNWKTLEWLRARARAPGVESAEAFAQSLADDLNEVLARVPAVARGIGIHFGAYELVKGYWVPELFWVTNYADPSYAHLRPRVAASRESFGTAAILGLPDDAPAAARRLAVHRWLADGRVLIYNNGDPILFNSVAPAIANGLSVLASRGLVESPSEWRAWSKVVRTPVEVVAGIVRDFAPRGQRAVGGRPHDLVVSAGGEYYTRSGG